MHRLPPGLPIQPVVVCAKQMEPPEANAQPSTELVYPKCRLIIPIASDVLPILCRLGFEVASSIEIDYFESPNREHLGYVLSSARLDL